MLKTICLEVEIININNFKNLLLYSILFIKLYNIY